MTAGVGIAIVISLALAGSRDKLDDQEIIIVPFCAVLLAQGLIDDDALRFVERSPC